MLDIETFGLRPGAQVRSIGAVLFDPRTGYPLDSFYCALNTDEQASLGMHVDTATVEWWQHRSDEAKGAFVHPAPLHDALLKFSDWYRAAEHHDDGLPYAWSLGSYFDFALLSELYAIAGVPYPIPHRKQLCMRSIGVISPFDWGNTRTPHHALHDAARQSRVLSASLSKLGCTRNGK